MSDLEPSVYARTESHFVVRLLTSANVLYARIWHDVTMLSPSQLPRTGAAIVVCNHTSGLDPSLIQAGCTRLVRWMMAKEFYEAKYAKWLYRSIGAIPVSRSGRDLASTRAALRALEAGHVLGIFPEGKIAPSRDLLPFQAGVALLAIKSGAPVFPARLDGTQRGQDLAAVVVRRQRATLCFGPEVLFDRSGTGRENLEAASVAIRAAVERLG